MLAHAVAAEMGGRGFSSGAAPRFMLFSTEATSFLTLARPSSVPIALAIEALRHCAVLNEELTDLELPFMQQAFLNQNVSLPRGPHLNEEGPMCFPKLQSLVAPGNTKNFG
jgi:hypothetical protein